MFTCENCGKELTVQLIVINKPFNKIDLYDAVSVGDFDILYLPEDEYVLVSCSCNNPKLSDEDEKLLSSYFDLEYNSESK